MAGINDGSVGHGDWETLDDRAHVDESSCVGGKEMTSPAGIGNSKGKGNRGGTCCCNISTTIERLGLITNCVSVVVTGCPPFQVLLVEVLYVRL